MPISFESTKLINIFNRMGHVTDRTSEAALQQLVNGANGLVSHFVMGFFNFFLVCCFYRIQTSSTGRVSTLEHLDVWH